MESKLPVAWVAELRETPEALARSVLYVLVAIVVALCTWYQWRKRRMEKLIEKIPGPPTWPLIGNAHLFLGVTQRDLIYRQLNLMNEYGSLLKFWLGPYLWVNLAEPKHLEAILTSEYATNKDPSYQFFKDQANGIFIASGENWKKLRKMVNPTFNQKLLEQFCDVFNEQSKVLLNIWEKKVDGPEFDIHPYVARCKLDIVCGTQMGVSSYEQLDNTSDFCKHLFLSTMITKERFFKIHLQPNLIFHMTDLSKQNKGHIEYLHTFVRGVVKQRRLARKEEEGLEDVLIDGKKKAVFLDVMLDHFPHLSDQEIAHKITDMFIAGSDTTGVASSYAIQLMGSHKDVQEKVYKEIIEVCGENDDDITPAHIPRLTYLEMVLKEVLRHFTIPVIVRKLNKDQDIGDGITLPAGTSVQLCFYGVHRDSRYWSHPHEFNPDHFLPENVAARPKFSYLPFGMGPRNCPGHHFAMMSMKVLVASIIRKYKIDSDVAIEKLNFNNVFMLENADGYNVKISRR